MPFNRAVIIDENFARHVAQWAADHSATPTPFAPDQPLSTSTSLTGQLLLELFDAQLQSRHLDLQARLLRSRDQGFYTISSSGHEGNAVLGELTRFSDPAFLHYRSGAWFIQRSRQLSNQQPLRDILLGTVASSEDPISGGRHKVFGSRSLWVPPQTSTIASHLPKAVGLAVSLVRAQRRGWPLNIPEDSIVLCNFGDATINHATALTGFNGARWLSYQKIPVPILLICEDNQWGISVKTPPGWVEHTFSHLPGFAYYSANGLDLLDAFNTTSQAVQYCRTHRAPVLLHLRTVRLMGHAGSDLEMEYRSQQELEEAERLDPLLRSAELVMTHGLLTPGEVIARYEHWRKEIQRIADEVVQRPKLTSAAEIMTSLAPYSPEAVQSEAARSIAMEHRRVVYPEGQLPENGPPRHLAVMINYALRELLAKYPQSLIFGEDVARKGGVYNITQGLQEAFGTGRVFNTLLDETNILGLASGAAHLGILPIPEIQYLAYFHNACDQIRGEACSLQYFSQDQFRNPMVVRIASFAYQKGFGGHFHNDNTVAPLRDIPGIIIACPARGDDAVQLLRSCAALAQVDGRVVLFLEPIALYMTRDLYAPKDGLWQSNYPPQGESAILGEGRVYHPEARELTIITFGNGVYLSMRAARQLAEQHNRHCRVVDLRWLQPLNVEFIAEQARISGRVLIVDETRRTGGLSEGIITALIEQGCGQLPIARVCAEDVYIPLGPAAPLVLPSEAQIIQQALQLLHR
ncbi:MAG: 1-deoxy-D-xylulose-5-phosphate synthase [Phycisphaerae bacterium]|nr:1-deoxy-D-xylulose-5-phosphate synthase [Phycisphaerae bacterium]